MQIISFLRRSLANRFRNVILRPKYTRTYVEAKKGHRKTPPSRERDKNPGKQLRQTSQGVITAPPRTNYGEDRRSQQASGGQARRAQRFQPEDRCQQSPPQGTLHKMFSF
jgi:hypothetical protein